MPLIYGYNMDMDNMDMSKQLIFELVLNFVDRQKTQNLNKQKNQTTSIKKNVIQTLQTAAPREA